MPKPVAKKRIRIKKITIKKTNIRTQKTPITIPRSLIKIPDISKFRELRSVKPKYLSHGTITTNARINKEPATDIIANNFNIAPVDITPLFPWYLKAKKPTAIKLKIKDAINELKESSMLVL